MSQCRHCGAALQGSEKFCGSCGASLGASPAQPTLEVPELTLTPPVPLVRDRAEEMDTLLPTTAKAIMDLEAPEAPGSAGMPETPSPGQEAGAGQNGGSAPVSGEYNYSYAPPRSEQHSPYAPPPPPVYPQQQPEKRPDRVLGTWGFVLSMFLMALPFAGFILQIIWACGGTQSLNRRNLARAWLIMEGIGLILAILLLVIGSVVVASVFGPDIRDAFDMFRYAF